MKRFGLSDIFNRVAALFQEECNDNRIDKLTEVKNLYALREALAAKEQACLILLNITSFSTINNAYGIDAGDMLLKGFTAILKQNLPNGGELYRCYGDEFAILLNDEGTIHAAELAEQIEGYLSFSTIDVGFVELKISITMGIASGEGTALLREASLALIDAKEERKSFSIYVANSEREIRIQKVFYWQTRLKDALTEGQLLPFYQPLLNNHTGKIDKFESLIRLRHEENIVLPMDFLDAAKEGGLLSAVTRIMISESFKDFSNNEYSFSVNITEQDLLNKNFLSFLDKKLQSNKIDPHRVYFELLEGISTDVANKSLETLREIKKMGCKLSIDDFGTEHSNFRRLLELDVDLIKIDGSFIKNLDNSEVSRKIVMAIIAFAKNIGAKTAAEFVHSAEIQRIVSQMGIDYSQGYYIGIPSPKVEIRIDEAFI
jgi:diguanylate cyclase (GGDEF)-like protein